MYRMKECLGKTGLSEKAVRVYMEKGLIKPRIEEGYGKRSIWFSDEDILRLKRIRDLRMLGFSIQDIGVILDGDRQAVDGVVDRHSEEMKAHQELGQLWRAVKEEYDKGEGDLEEVINKVIVKRRDERLFVADFSRLDEEEEDTEYCREGFDGIGGRKRLTYGSFCKIAMPRLLCILLMGLLFLPLYVDKRNREYLEGLTEYENFAYEILESNITVSEVEWSDFPAWKTVDILLDGTMVITTPKDEDVKLADIVDASAMVELSREHKVISDGTDIMYYDEVTYKLTDAWIEGKVIKNNDNWLSSIGQYNIRLMLDNEAGDISVYYAIGSIIAGCDTVIPWTTSKQRLCAGNIIPYLDAFSLSRTYGDKDAGKSPVEAEGIVLTKSGTTFLSATLSNQGEADWQYSAALPALEMWYNGIWLEIVSPYADPLILKTLVHNTTETMEVPGEITLDYPELFYGTYRLVIWGKDNTYAVSDEFIIYN